MKLQECAEFDDDVGNYPKGDNLVSYLAERMKNKFRRNNRVTSTPVADYEDDTYCGLDDECMVDRRALPWCLLPPVALSKCVDSFNRPLWICDRLSQELADVGYSDNFTSRERLAFLSQIDKLSKCIGECERIHQTAVPLNYARHSLRSLTIWLFSLPFALVGEFGLLTAPVMAVISWLLFGVYQIGYTIEDPFQGSLRLSILCDAVYRDVMYDADMKNKRDSAFELEDELLEWDRLGPIDDPQYLLSESSSATIAPTTNTELSSIEEVPPPQTEEITDEARLQADQDIPLANGPSRSNEADSDPMLPRP